MSGTLNGRLYPPVGALSSGDWRAESQELVRAWHLEGAPSPLLVNHQGLAHRARVEPSTVRAALGASVSGVPCGARCRLGLCLLTAALASGGEAAFSGYRPDPHDSALHTGISGILVDAL